ncbi:ComEC family competence protein [Sphingomonas piscis]|uniref:ComEC family competence protein n=1 Tax=Sphingomonas piscis TaxID=2714943 RepID=A0A6G7YSQ8_9SPHN|nr:ComEC/Rec2 family competence protein [Sphingomonas piscis]QIK79769.1 ComEC family competence protein [Sphingomonas piscis]
MQWTSAPTIAGAPHPQRARGFGQARLSAILEGIEAFLERERAQLPLWLVAGFGAGIAGWFTLGSPAAWAAFLCLCAALAVVGLLFPPTRTGRAVSWFAAAAALGCALVWGRAEWIAAPKLSRPVVTEMTGRVVAVEQLVAKGDVRLLLVPDSKNLPPKVRVSAKVDGVSKDVNRGSLVRLRARLAPPPSMALPGSYDFSRDAWFKGIGGVGRVLGPVVLVKKGEGAFLDRTRERLGTHIRERLPGAKGGIAAALVTGDQNGVPEDDAEAMRRSGLTHLLSVSGLHIAAVIGAVMFLTLRLLALSETLALRFNLVLVSAAAAAGAVAGIFYTLLTGAQVPTVRSCVAALLVLAGIALGRDALSMRLLAVGALVVLLFRPEAIAGASFQFSFAAVAAIIALHSSAWARRHLQAREEPWWARGLRWFGGMIATGLAVEAALIPFALFHFHKAGLYGVGANILAIPLTTFVIMPLEAAALLADAIGLGAPLWAPTSWALGLLLGIAHAVAGTTGAVATVASIPTWCFALFAAGGLWICLWVSPIRWLGLAPVAFAAIGTLLKADRKFLEQTGGLAITLGSTPHVASVAAQVGDHPWAATTSPQ